MFKKSSLFILSMGMTLNLVAEEAWCWGQTGHRIVGQVAYKHLSGSTRRALEKIMGHERPSRSSTKPDEYRSLPEYNPWTPLHFADIPVGMTYTQAPKAPEGDAITGISWAIRVVKSSNTTPAQKAEALRLLIHLVGDIHQPLHAGYTNDLGGNLCRVKYMGSLTNLHAVLDDGLINNFVVSYTEFAQFLEDEIKDKYSKVDLKKLQEVDLSLQPSPQIVSWVNESVAVREALYPANTLLAGPDGKLSVPQDPALVAAAPQGHTFCASIQDRSKKIPDELIPVLSYEYGAGHAPTSDGTRFNLVERRLAEAGLRLAAILNKLLPQAGKDTKVVPGDFKAGSLL